MGEAENQKAHIDEKDGKNFILHEEDGITIELVDSLRIAHDMEYELYFNSKTGRYASADYDAVGPDWEKIYERPWDDQKREPAEPANQLYNEVTEFFNENQSGGQRISGKGNVEMTLDGDFWNAGYGFTGHDCLVARKNGEIVGVLTMKRNLLDKMAVDPGIRKSVETGEHKPISELLFKVGVPLALAKGQKEIYSEPESVQGEKFDKRMGFEQGQARHVEGYFKYNLDPRMEAAAREVLGETEIKRSDICLRGDELKKLMTKLQEVKEVLDPMFDEHIAEYNRERQKEGVIDPGHRK